MNGRAKLADFGTCQKIKNGDSFEFCSGTLQFQAPESMTQERFEGKPCDIWAFGLTVYAYFYRKFPFLEDNVYVQL